MTSQSHGFVHRITSKNGLLSAFAAVLMVLTVPVLLYATGTGIMTLGALGTIWTGVFATIFLMAATRLFGKGTLDAVQQARNNDQQK